MKSKLRRIQIDARTFLWRVTRLTPSTVSLRIWAGGRAAQPWADVTCPLDDFWLHFKEKVEAGSSGSAMGLAYVSVTPKLVAEVIRMAMRHVEPADGQLPLRLFELSQDGLLTPCADGTFGSVDQDGDASSPIPNQAFHDQPDAISAFHRT